MSKPSQTLASAQPVTKGDGERRPVAEWLTPAEVDALRAWAKEGSIIIGKLLDEQAKSRPKS